MRSQLFTLTIFALLVSTVFATLMRDEPREQARTAGWMFAGFLATAIALAWLMYPLPL
jgi:hypothetical protein